MRKVEFLKCGAPYGFAYNAGDTASIDADVKVLNEMVKAGVIVPLSTKSAKKETR
jgi:hypothetical protein